MSLRPWCNGLPNLESQRGFRFFSRKDGTPYADELESILICLGGEASLNITSSQAMLIVRGNEFTGRSPKAIYKDAKAFVERGGLLILTSFVSWETNALETFREVLPFEHLYGNFDENTLVKVSATLDSGLDRFIAPNLSIRNTFEHLRPKKESKILLLQDGIPLLGICDAGRGQCIYINACQHLCDGAMESPIWQSPGLGEAISKVIGDSLTRFIESRAWV